MRKMASLTILVAIGCAAIAVYLWAKPPLVEGALYTEQENQHVIISLGNEGVTAIQIEEIFVNNGETPSATGIQVSHALAGYSLSTGFKKGTPVTPIDEMTIPTNSHPLVVYEKLDAGTATTADLIYGLQISHHQAINEVTSHYLYAGLPLKKVINLEV